MTLRAKRATFHVEGVASDFHAALDQALASLAAQIRRRKERVTAKKPAAVAAAVRPGTGRGRRQRLRSRATRRPPVVVRRTNAKPMSLEEAVDQLRLRSGRPPGLPERAHAGRQRPAAAGDGTVELVEPAG